MYREVVTMILDTIEGGYEVELRSEECANFLCGRSSWHLLAFPFAKMHRMGQRPLTKFSRPLEISAKPMRIHVVH